jgi:hypothetical protein
MLSQRSYKSIHGSPRSLVPLSLEFTPELKTIALPLIPAFGHILSVAIKPTAAAFVAQLRFPIGNTTAEPVAHSPFSHTETACDLFEGETGFAQVKQLLIAIRSLCVASQVSTSRRGSVCRRPLRKCGGLCLQCLADLATAACEDFFHDLRQVLCHMKPIRTLRGLRSAESGSGCILFSPVPTHHFNFRVCSHPGGSRFGVPIR